MLAVASSIRVRVENWRGVSSVTSSGAPSSQCICENPPFSHQSSRGIRAPQKDLLLGIVPLLCVWRDLTGPRSRLELPSFCVLFFHLRQSYTQFGGLRPFGVSFLFAGWDKYHGFQLYHTDPSGNYSGWKATAIGVNNQSAQTILKQVG